jgi:hypothetical protein
MALVFRGRPADLWSEMPNRMRSELDAARAELRLHLASWEYAFAMAGGCHGGRDHPVHWATHARTDALRRRCVELEALVAEHEA